MKVNISSELIHKFNNNLSFIKVKILHVNKNSSTIFLNNIKIDIPHKLNLKSEYIAKIKKNTIDITEVKKNTESINKKDIKTIDINNFFDKIYENNEEKNTFFDIMNSLNLIKINDNYNKKKYSKQTLLKSNEGYNFFLNLPFYNHDAKFYIFIDNKNININIFPDNANKTQEIEFKKNIDNLMKRNYRNLNIFYCENNNDFYNKIKNNLNLKIVDLDI